MQFLCLSEYKTTQFLVAVVSLKLDLRIRRNIFVCLVMDLVLWDLMACILNWIFCNSEPNLLEIMTELVLMRKIGSKHFINYKNWSCCINFCEISSKM